MLVAVVMALVMVVLLMDVVVVVVLVLLCHRRCGRRGVLYIGVLVQHFAAACPSGAPVWSERALSAMSVREVGGKALCAADNGLAQKRSRPEKTSQSNTRQPDDFITVYDRFGQAVNILMWTPDGRSCKLCGEKDTSKDRVWGSQLPGRRWAYPVKVARAKNDGNNCYHCVKLHAARYKVQQKMLLKDMEAHLDESDKNRERFLMLLNKSIAYTKDGGSGNIRGKLGKTRSR